MLAFLTSKAGRYALIAIAVVIVVIILFIAIRRMRKDPNMEQILNQQYMTNVLWWKQYYVIGSNGIPLKPKAGVRGLDIKKGAILASRLHRAFGQAGLGDDEEEILAVFGELKSQVMASQLAFGFQSIKPETVESCLKTVDAYGNSAAQFLKDIAWSAFEITPIGVLSGMKQYPWLGKRLVDVIENQLDKRTIEKIWNILKTLPVT